ncbi:MAG: NAD(P)/FAD-dependent oxidoreductase, partial [Candidatus Aureabacteria bacterium]|nr:NAD(P)/FAD-dependent oxidoreductase [Candidatus Auribacterota bacterium]
MKAVIIGGGITGLSTGYELARRGHQVTILEREARVGGLAGSFRIGGAWIEKFYHHIFKSDTAVTGWIDELGLRERLLWRASPMGFFHKGRVHRFGTPMELLRFSPLSLIDRIRLGLSVLNFQRMSNWEELDGITCEKWFSIHVSAKAYRMVWEPLLKLKFGDAYSQIPAAWIWGRIHPRARSRSRGGMREELGYLQGGFELMIERLRAKIVAMGGTVIEGTAAEYIIQDRTIARGVVAGGHEFFSDIVVSTIAVPAFLQIAPPLPEDYTGRLSLIRYQAVVCMVLECEESVSPVYWLNISDPSVTFGGLIEHTNFIAPAGYGGKRIIYLFNYLKEDDPLFSLDAEAYLAHHEASLKRINPRFERSWVKGMHLFRARYGTVVYTMGYASAIPPFATPIKRLSMVNT